MPSISKALGLTTNKYAQVVSLLFNARTNAHIAHLQTRSFAQHKALDDFYSQIIDIADSFAESAMGSTNQVLTGFDIGQLHTGEIVQFLQKQYKELLTLRGQFTEGHLVQLIDDACELYTSTIYKLSFLK